MFILHWRSLPPAPRANHYSYTQYREYKCLNKFLGKYEKGLTLIEVMLTTALMSLGLLAVANMQIVSMQVNTASTNLAQATMATQEVMERLVSLPFNHPDLSDPTPLGYSFTHVQADPPPGYTISWEVDLDHAPDLVLANDKSDVQKTKKILITVAWGQADEQKSLILPLQMSTISNPRSDSYE